MKLKAMLIAGAMSFVPMTAMAADLTIGFSQIGSESGWRAAETTVTKQEAEKRGIDLKFADAQQKQENQIKAIRSFIAQGVDAILLAPVVATGWDEVLEEAKDAEIPVVLLDRTVDAPEDLYMTAVTSDLVHEAASPASGWLMKLPARSATSSNFREQPVPAPPSIARRASSRRFPAMTI